MGNIGAKVRPDVKRPSASGYSLLTYRELLAAAGANSPKLPNDDFEVGFSYQAEQLPSEGCRLRQAADQSSPDDRRQTENSLTAPRQLTTSGRRLGICCAANRTRPRSWLNRLNNITNLALFVH